MYGLSTGCLVLDFSLRIIINREINLKINKNGTTQRNYLQAVNNEYMEFFVKDEIDSN